MSSVVKADAEGLLNKSKLSFREWGFAPMSSPRVVVWLLSDCLSHHSGVMPSHRREAIPIVVNDWMVALGANAACF